MGRADVVERPLVSGVGISHPDRQVYPALAFTKLNLARYYERIAEWMLPHVAGRPLTLVRCPDGAPADPASEGGCFYMKHSKLWAPPALRRVRIREKTKVGEYLVADSAAAVVSLVQMGVLEIHTWNATCARLEQPDRIVIDLDPGAGVGWPAVIEAARLVRDLLAIMELRCFVKTTGGRGLHIVVPIVPREDWSECLAFARALGDVLVRRDPSRFTTNFAKAGREHQLLVDYLRNNRTNTSVAAYSTRARAGAPVSVPLAWSELSASRPPHRHSVKTVPTRLARLAADPWREYWHVTQHLPRAAVTALERM
jgi:bifunctional non-homologous end joining protein LigD